MNFFGFYNHNKPGKGVEKSDIDMPPYKLFFAVFGRKFTRILGLNFIYLMFAIPLLLLLLLALSPVVVMFPVAEYFQLYMYGAFAFLATIGFAPLNVGMAYVLRNFARQEHAYVFQDFWQQVKLNFKKSIIVMLADFVVIGLLFADYVVMGQVIKDSNLLLLMTLTLYVVTFLYVVMHFYIYQLICTFDIKLTDIYKNALLLTMAKLPMNILLCLSLFALGCFFILYPYFYVISVAVFAYIINFYVQRVIARYMIEHKSS